MLARLGAGINGSDRVELVWADNAIQKQWLQVTMKANANTGLAADDVFYFGNAVGSTGDSTTSASVNSADDLGARTHKTGLSTATITNLYDFNRDRHVHTQDELIARSNHSGLSPLKLITVPATGVGGGTALIPAATASEVPALASVPPAVTVVSTPTASVSTPPLPSGAAAVTPKPAAPSIQPATKPIATPFSTGSKRTKPVGRLPLTKPAKTSTFSVVRIPILPHRPSALSVVNGLLGAWTGAVWAEKRESSGVLA